MECHPKQQHIFLLKNKISYEKKKIPGTKIPHVLELVQNIFLIGHNMLEIQYSTGPQDLLALAQYNPPKFQEAFI